MVKNVGFILSIGIVLTGCTAIRSDTQEFVPVATVSTQVSSNEFYQSCSNGHLLIVTNYVNGTKIQCPIDHTIRVVNKPMQMKQQAVGGSQPTSAESALDDANTELVEHLKQFRKEFTKSWGEMSLEEMERMNKRMDYINVKQSIAYWPKHGSLSEKIKYLAREVEGIEGKLDIDQTLLSREGLTLDEYDIWILKQKFDFVTSRLEELQTNAEELEENLEDLE